MDAVKEALKGLLSSKKSIAMIAGAIVSIVGKIGFDLPVEVVASVVGLVAAYVVGQGMADWGKEAAKVSEAMKEKSGS